MKTFLKATALALMATASVAPIAAYAQVAPATLTVDLDRAFNDSIAGKGATVQIKAKYETNLNAAVSAYNTASATLNSEVEAARKVIKPDGTLPPANQKSAADAQNAYNATSQRLEGLQTEVNAVQRYVQQQILQAAAPIIEQVRAERKATVVLPRGSVLASDAAGDITAVVVQRLDLSLKTVSITPPRQGGGAPAATTPATPSARPPVGR